jgi:methylphosphotriester-DNA--protein-cysteine methyltransferase
MEHCNRKRNNENQDFNGNVTFGVSSTRVYCAVRNSPVCYLRTPKKKKRK